MSSKTTHEIDIVTVAQSKINSIDFENISFGTTFTDHMFVCDFKDWNAAINGNGRMVVQNSRDGNEADEIAVEG